MKSTKALTNGRLYEIRESSPSASREFVCGRLAPWALGVVAFALLCQPVAWAQSENTGAVTKETVIARFRELQAKTGTFRAKYRVDIRAVHLTSEPDKTYELKANIGATAGPTRFRIDDEYEVVWYPEKGAEGQILQNRETVVFDGEKAFSYFPDDKRGTVDSSPELTHGNPRAHWLSRYGKPLDEHLENPDTASLGSAEMEGRTCVGFQVPVANPGDTTPSGRVHRFWFDVDAGLFPVRLEFGDIAPEDGEFTVGSQVVCRKIGTDANGVPYPQEVVTDLFYSTETGELKSFCQRTFVAEEFQAGIEVPDRFYTLDFPDDTYVTDMVTGISYEAGEARGTRARNLGALVEQAREEVEVPVVDASASAAAADAGTPATSEETAPERSGGDNAPIRVLVVAGVCAALLLTIVAVVRHRLRATEHAPRS